LAFRFYFRLVYHTSPFNTANVVNVPVAQAVWSDNPILRYQNEAFNTGSFQGYGEFCRIDITMTGNTAALSSTDWPLVIDNSGNATGFRITQRNLDGTETNTPDGDRLFRQFYNPSTPDTVLVFQFPQLITVDENGNDLPRGYNGIAFDGDAVGFYSPFDLYLPSIWINTRVAQQYAPKTVFAHEIAHIVLNEPPAFSTLWGDNSTSFLHIQTSVGEDKLAWIPNPGVVGLVTASDVNRQTLISVDGQQQCFDAKSSRYVKWEIVQ